MLQCLDNCVGKFMTAHQSIFQSTYNIHFAHQSIFQSTYNIHFAHLSIWHITYKHSFSYQNIQYIIFRIVCPSLIGRTQHAGYGCHIYLSDANLTTQNMAATISQWKSPSSIIHNSQGRSLIISCCSISKKSGKKVNLHIFHAYLWFLLVQYNTIQWTSKRWYLHDEMQQYG